MACGMRSAVLLLLFYYIIRFAVCKRALRSRFELDNVSVAQIECKREIEKRQRKERSAAEVISSTHVLASVLAL